MSTDTIIKFALVDVTAKGDGTPSLSVALQPWSDIEQITQEDRALSPYGTLELNQFVLNGKKRPTPNDPSAAYMGLWSQDLSEATGVFAEAPVLTVDFTEPHTSNGITLTCHEHSNDYCDQVNIKWYNLEGQVLADEDFAPSSASFFCENEVEDFCKIVITFFRTNKPGRYLKLLSIDYGQLLTFAGGQVLEAEVLEEVDPISEEVSINTLHFKLYSEDEDFSIINPAGVYRFLRSWQRVDVWENIDADTQFMGTFYLDVPESESETITSMECVDAIGLMDGTIFRGGIYADVPAEDLLAEIFSGAGVKYSLDPAFEGAVLSGWLPICTHKEALQQAAFAMGAIVDCSRTHLVKVMHPDSFDESVMGKARKIRGHSLKQRPLVTSVSVTSHDYVAADTSRSLFSGTLPAGLHEITFSEPAHTLTVTGATITESGANYAILSVAADGAVTLTGKDYTDMQQVTQAAMADVPAGEALNDLQVTEATLVSKSVAADVARRVYDYHQLRLEETGRVIVGAEQAGALITIASMSNQEIRGRITSMDIDLVGGFLAEMTVIGEKVG